MLTHQSYSTTDLGVFLCTVQVPNHPHDYLLNMLITPRDVVLNLSLVAAA
jgi:hypothetical protein